MKASQRSDGAALLRAVLHVVLAGAGVTAAVACGALDTKFEDCTIPCNGLCPSGSECRNGYCVHDGSNATCSQEGDIDSGAPGNGTGGAHTMGGSGGRSTSGNSGGASPATVADGSAESGAEAGDALHISTPASHSMCTGHAGRISFHATGGNPPYVWSVSGVPFDLAGTDTDELIVTGTPSTSTDYTLDATVTDAAHQTAHVAFALHASDPPRVTTTTLPPACANQQYAATLEASGSDPDTYRWDISSLASGITVAGPTLTATMAQAGSTTLTATVTDGNCTSDPVELTLKVDDANCPHFAQADLPAPCRTNAYPGQIVDVIGGKKPYKLSAPSIPAGITFDPATRTISGVANSDDPLVLQVEDDLGHVVQHTYPMTARDSCWLGFVSTAAAGTTQLHLVDPILWSDRAFPAAPVANEPAIDFQFSPDGRYLAYRLGSPGGETHLVLMSAPLWDERAIAIDGTVQQYAWSPNSRTLAVSFDRGGVGYLGGIKDVAAANTPGTNADGGAPDRGTEDGGATGSSAPPMLEPTEATVGSELYWNGNEAVGFHIVDPNGSQILKYAHLGADAFDPPTDVDPFSVYAPNVVVRVGSDGSFFAIEPGQHFAFYSQFDGNGPYFSPYAAGTIDPQGRYVARIANGTLDLVNPNGRDFARALASNADCRSLLAWAPHAQRLACLRQSNSPNSVDVLDFDESKSELTPATVGSTYDYLPGDSQGRRRAFSDGGNWFAFTTTQRVYVATLSQGTPYVVGADAPFGDVYSGPTELAFSPDEHWLLSQRGTTVMLHDLTKSPVSVAALINPSIYAPPAAKACAERFLDDPDRWCGSPRTDAWFLWSPNSQFVAARTAGGAIQAWHIKTVEGTTQREWDTVCSTGCGDQLSFQP